MIMTWVGKDPSLPSLLLNSHMDVVPCFTVRAVYYLLCSSFSRIVWMEIVDLSLAVDRNIGSVIRLRR